MLTCVNCLIKLCCFIPCYMGGSYLGRGGGGIFFSTVICYSGIFTSVVYDYKTQCMSALWIFLVYHWPQIPFLVLILIYK